MSIKLYYNDHYTKNKDKYKESYTLYEGDQKELKTIEYLWPHELELTKEGNGIRVIREQRSAYTNFIEPIISYWTSLFLEKEPFIDDETKSILEDELKNIDGKGKSLNSFLQDDFLVKAMLTGMPILQASALGQRPANLSEQSSSAAYKPMLEVVCPMKFVDWSFEYEDPKRINKLNFCRLEYYEQAKRLSATDEPKKELISVEYKIKENKLVKIKYKLVEKTNKNDKQGDSWEVVSEDVYDDWDEIPITVMILESWVKDLNPHVLKYYNLESVIDNICLYQAHQRVFLIGDISKTQLLGASEYCYANLPLGSSVTTIEPGDTTSTESRLASVLNNIFRIAFNQSRMMSSDSKVGQAVESIKQEKEGVYSLIKAQAEVYESIINDALRLLAKYKGNDSLQPQFKFNLDIDENNIDSFVKLVSLFRDEISKLPSVRKKLVTKAITDIGIDQDEETEKEIDTMINQPSVIDQAENLRNRLVNGITNRATTAS